MSYDQHGIDILNDRRESRKTLSKEERRTQALEQIADTLLAIEYALDRIADKD